MTLNLSSLGALDCSSGVCFDNSAIISATITPTNAPSQTLLDQALNQLPSTSVGFDQALQTQALSVSAPGVIQQLATTLGIPSTPTMGSVLALGLAGLLGLVFLTGGRRK
jgi:hypothetical protein